MADDRSRKIETKRPVGLIIGALAIGLAILGFVFYAVWISGEQIADAKMRGTIFAKEFVPLPNNEVDRQITIGAVGLEAQNVRGQYILKVRVPQKEGHRDFDVIVAEKLYNELEVGDSFDVGPYLVPPDAK